MENATTKEVDDTFYDLLYPSNGGEMPIHTVKQGAERPDESGSKPQASTGAVQVVYVKQDDRNGTLLMAGILAAVLLLWLQIVFGDN